MGGACSTYGERRGAYRVLVGKPEGRSPFGRPRRGWKDNIKSHLRKVGLGRGGPGLDRSGPVCGQLTGPCECVNEPLGSIKCGELLD
jgi:hypothetical protein